MCYIIFMSKYRKLYEDTHGEIEPDWHVHHIDWNHNNNVIDNLISLPRKVHELIHGYLGYVNREEIIELTKLFLSNKNYRKKSVSYLNSKLNSAVDTNKGCKLSISCRDRLDKQIENYHTILKKRKGHWKNKREWEEVRLNEYREAMMNPPKEPEDIESLSKMLEKLTIPTRKTPSNFNKESYPWKRKRRLRKL